METTRMADAFVEVGEQLRKYRLNLVANTIVIVDEEIPIDPAGGQRGLGDATDDGNFGFQLLARRLDQAG